MFDVLCAEERAARARSQRAGTLDRYATGTANDPGEDEEEGNAVGNCKQPERNPVWVSHSWTNKNVPTSSSITLGITGVASVRLTKEATKIPAEVNATRAGTTAQELHRVLMGGNLMPHNIFRGEK